MVAFLEKPAESNGFHEIIDFLNANQIRYALTVNPTIYTTCIEQFWATAKVNMVNGECGTDCLPTDTIFEELARMGYKKPSTKLTFYKAFFSPQWKFLIHTITQCLSAKTTERNEFSSTMASTIICLATNQKFNLSKYIFDAMTPITTQPSTSKPQKKQSRRKQRKDIEVSQSSASTKPMTEKETNKEFVPKHSYDTSQSGEDRMQLHELMNLCTKLSDRVLALETTKTTQALEIASLKSRGRSDDKEMFNTDALIGDEVFAKIDMTKKEHDVIPKEVSVAEILTTIGIKILVSIAAISTAAPSTIVVSPPVITESRVTTTPSTIVKAKGITFRDAGETTTRTPTSVSSSSIKDKGKAKMDKPKVPLNKKDQIRLDEELTRRLDAKEQEVARPERENEQKQGELTIEENSKKIMELMNERKRHFAKLRAEEKRRKPLTKEVKSSKKKAEGSRKKLIGKKRAGNEQKQESSKRQRIEDDKETDEHEEPEEDDEAEMKKHMEIVQDKEEIAIDAIPLATKPPMIVEYKIVKKGQKGFYHLIRAGGSSKRYSSMIKMFQNIDREDFETIWKLVKAKHGNTRLEDDYERVFLGDLKVMFEPDIKSEVWRSLQG
ncbi:hypothetical protein Tco_0464294 [Tanacetum coccineum]